MEKYLIPKEKLAQLEQMLINNDIDTLLILSRERSDHIVPFLTGVDTVGTTAFFLNKNGEHTVIASQADSGNYAEGGLFKNILTYGKSLEEQFVPYFEQLNPSKMALNFSKEDVISDGLTLGLYIQLTKMVGKERLEKIEMSSQKLIQELRSVKTPTEIAILEKSIQITNDIYDEVWTRVKCGMSEKEIGDIFVDCMKKRDVVNGLGSPYAYPIVCIVRAGLAHRGPGDTKTIPGDIVIMDFSVNYKGYISDIARTAYILKDGETQPPHDIQHAFDTAYKAISDTIAFIGEGKLGHEVDAVGRKTVEEGGFPTVRHSVGHPIGRACHDSGTSLGPIRENGNKAVYRPIQLNEVYAIEPTVIQDDGKPCMLVEENVVITEKGARVLSRRQTQLYLIQG